MLVIEESVGINLHVGQDNDFIVRNPIYETLIRDDWPIYSARNEYFVYYLSYWLVPAGLVKLCPSISPEWCLFAWVYLGMALAAVLAFVKLRGKTITLTLAFLFGSLIFRGYGDYVFYAEELMGTPDFPVIGRGLFDLLVRRIVVQSLHYVGGWLQISNTFNHAVPMLLFLSLCLMRRIPMPLLIFLSALIVGITPLGGVAALPLLAIGWFVAVRKCMKETLAGTAVAAVSALPLLLVYACYFSCGSGSLIYFVWQHADYSYYEPWEMLEIFLWLAFQWLNFWVLYRVYRGRFKNRMIPAVMMSTAVLCSCVWMGRPHTNELLFKGSLIPFACLALMFALRWWDRPSKGMRVLLVLVLLSSAVHAYRGIHKRILPSYSWNAVQMQKNKQDDWNGTLDHPFSPMYGQFWAVKSPNVTFFKVRDDVRLYPEDRTGY